MQSKKELSLFFWIFTIMAGSAFILPNLFSKGMFIDGLFYANMARNLAEGKGSFWVPFNTVTVNPQFFDHPPLVFGIESLFFRLFGDHYLVEKIYSLLTLLFSGWILIKIWNILTLKPFIVWLPILLWLVTPLVYWAYVNNILEDTMGVFCFSCCLILLYSWKHGKTNLALSVLAGLFLVGGILSKGPFALFPLAFPFFYWLVYRKIRFVDCAISTILLILVCSTFFLILLQWPAAYNNLHNYLNIQFFPSLKGQRDQVSIVDRYFLVKALGNQFIPIFSIGAAVLITKWIWFKKTKIKPAYKHALFFLLSGISASFPIMISPKQMIQYVLCSIPFYAMSAAVILAPYIEYWILKINTDSKTYRNIKKAFLIATAIILAFSVSRINKSGRDAKIFSALQEIQPYLPKGEVVDCNSNLFYNWQLNMYLYRFYHVSIDYKSQNSIYYLASKKDTKSVPQSYVLLNSDTNDLLLFKKKTLLKN